MNFWLLSIKSKDEILANLTVFVWIRSNLLSDSSAREGTANPLGDVDFDNSVLLRIFSVVQRESNGEVQDDCNEVSKTECAILPHVTQHDDAQDLSRQSESDLQQSVS